MIRFKWQIKTADWLIALLLMLMLLNARKNGVEYIQMVCGVGIVYYSTRIISSIYPLITVSVLFPFCIIIICFLETILGFWQLFTSNMQTGVSVCVGSFDNPGPYGGFLSICICILESYVVKPNTSNKKIYFIVISMAMIMLITTNSRASFLTLIIGSFIAFRSTPGFKKLIRNHTVVLSLCFIITAIGAYLYKKPSADARLFINMINLRLFQESGLLGIGFGHYGGAYGEAQYNYFHNIFPNITTSTIESIKDIHVLNYIDCPVFAFNDYLQFGIEGGWLLLAILIAVLSLSLKQAINKDKACFIGLVCFSVFAFFSYPLEKTELRLLLPMLLALSQISKQPSVEKPTPSRIFCFVSLSFFLAFSVGVFSEVRKVKISRKQWEGASYNYYVGEYDMVLNRGDRVKKWLSNDFTFLFEYGNSLSKREYYSESDSILKIGISICSDPMFWNVLGNNSIAQGNYREAEERYEHAFYTLPNRLFPLYNLAKLYHTEGDTTRFLEMADIVETFVPKIESINTESLREEIRDLRTGYISECAQYEN